jgi:hypothetical protein
MEVITNGYLRKCKDGTGGLNKIYLFPFVKYSRSQVVIQYEVLSFFPNNNIYEFDILGNPSFNESMSENEGGKFLDQSITVNILNTFEAFEIQKLLQKDYRAIIQDNNGKYRMLGLYNGLEADNLTQSIGSSKTDFNGFKVNFKGQELRTAPFLNDLEFFTINEAFFLLYQNSERIFLQNLDNTISQNG